MSRNARHFEEFYRAVSRDIFKFAEALNFRPTWQQTQLLNAVQQGRQKIAVRSGQGPGKTTTSSVVGLWRLLRPWSKLIVTAPTMRQCKDVWLAEAERLLREANHPALNKIYNVTTTSIGMFGNKAKSWGALLITSTKAEQAQGQHRKNMDLIVEEASGVSRELIEQYKGTLSNPNALFLQIGNPNCVLGDTEVYDPSQGLVTVKSLSEKEKCRVSSIDKEEIINKYSARAFYSGKKECLTLSVRSGQELKLSLDHPVYTPKGWVKAGLLKKEDLVAMPRFLPEPDRSEQPSEEEIKFVAYMLTDGGCSKDRGVTSRCTFTQMPGPVLNEFNQVVNSLGGGTTTKKEKGKALGVGVSGVQKLLRKWELACKKGKEKRVPKKFFLLSKKDIGLFLNRVWSCDGSFNRYGPKICLCNKKLLDDIQTLLLRLGIHSSIWYTQARIKKHHNTFDYLKGREFDAWTLGITEKESQEKWRRFVGDVLGKEGKGLTASGGNPNVDIVPVTNKEVMEMLEELKIPRGKKGKRNLLSRKYRRVRNLSRIKFQEFCDETRYEGKYKTWATNNLRWVRVKTIKRIGVHPVYDLTVPDAGNFVANNLVIHNTRDCSFFDCFNGLKKKWCCLHWNAEETPESEWFSRERNRELADEYGVDSDVYRIRVLGQFPHTDPNCVISSEMLEKVTDRKLLLPASQMPRLDLYGGGLARQIGQDFARFGGDENTIFRRSGNAIVEWEHMAHTDPSVAVDIAFRMQKDAGWRDSDCWYVADAGGMGQGIMHRFYDAQKNIVEFHNGGKSGEQDYDDKITEAWFHVARLVKKGGCYLPPDNRTLQQLSNRQYYTTRKGKLKLESKDEYMKRGHESPDRADGVVMALYDAVRTSGHISSRGQSDYIVGTGVQRN